MAVKQINKRIKKVDVPIIEHKKAETPVIDNGVKDKKNKVIKNEDMTTEQIERAENLTKELGKQKVKVIKKEKGLIERTESEKIVLTEDNRQVLTD